MLLLPSAVDDLVFSCLSPRDLFRCARVSKAFNQRIASYKLRAFRIEKQLSRFFSPDEIARFRQWQLETGMIVSGSAALQFFDRSDYGAESDLELYVEHRHGFEFVCWLETIGYVLRPRSGQGPNLQLAWLQAGPWPRNSEALEPNALPRNPMPGYRLPVLNFYRGEPENKIQLVISLGAVLNRVLNFDSSRSSGRPCHYRLLRSLIACVMNIITHSTASSLYPMATFERRRSLVYDLATLIRHGLREKYERLGWRVEDALTEDHDIGIDSDFPCGERWVGDAACWTMKLHPALDAAPDYDLATANSWTHEYHVEKARIPVYFAEIEANILTSPDLRHSYTMLSERKSINMISAVVQRVLEDTGHFDDEVWLDILLQYRERSRA